MPVAYWLNVYSFSKTLSLPGKGQLMMATPAGSVTSTSKSKLNWSTSSHVQTKLSPSKAMVGGRFTSTSKQ